MSEKILSLNTKKDNACGIAGFLCLYTAFMVQIYIDPILWPVAGKMLGIGNAYTLALTVSSMTSAVCTPIVVKLTTRISVIRIMHAAAIFQMIIFPLQAFVHTVPLLLLLRAVTGIGLAFLFTALLKAIGDFFPPERRGFWIGVQGALMGGASIVIPPLTGALIDHSLFTAVFFVTIPFYLIGILLLRKSPDITPPAEGKPTSIPWKNAVAWLIALSAFFLITSKDNFHFSAPQLAALIALGIGAALLTFRLEKRAGENAILPLRVCRDRNFLLITLTSFTAAASGTFLYYAFSYYMLTYMGANGTETGIAIGLQFLITLIFAPFLGKYLHKKEVFRRGILLSGILMIFIYLWFALCLDARTPLYAVNIAMILFGIYAMVISVIYSYAAQNLVVEDQRAYAVGGYKLATSLGYSIPLSIFTLILNEFTAVPEMGYDILYLISIGLTLATVILTMKIKIQH